MFRWLRIAALGIVVVALIAVGVGVGLFLVSNAEYVPIETHPWLAWLFGKDDWEVRMPLLLSGWLACVLLGGVLLAWSMYYLWRRRQYESLIARLERELINLRNLPFEQPAPFEDVREVPDRGAAQKLAALDAAYDGQRRDATAAGRQV